jgi:hypothetical protein
MVLNYAACPQAFKSYAMENRVTSTTPSSWVGYKYRCRVNGTKSSRETTIKFSNKWTGAISQAWENPANWSCGKVPDINTDVIISTGPVVINSNVTIRSLKLDADVIFTVNTPYILTVTH